MWIKKKKYIELLDRIQFLENVLESKKYEESGNIGALKTCPNGCKSVRYHPYGGLLDPDPTELIKVDNNFLICPKCRQTFERIPVLTPEQMTLLHYGYLEIKEEV